MKTPESSFPAGALAVALLIMTRMKKRAAAAAVLMLLLAGGGWIYLSLEGKQRECWAKLTAKVAGSSNLPGVLHREIASFQLLVERSLVARSKILEVLTALKKKGDSPLSGRDLEVLRSGTVYYLDLRGELYDAAERYECAIGLNSRFISQQGIDPLLYVKAVLFSLAAALTLNDNWVLAAGAFEHEPRLRRLLDDPDAGFHIPPSSLTTMQLAAHSPVVRERVRRALRFYERGRKTLLAEGDAALRAAEDQDYQYLDLLITKSPSFSLLRARRPGSLLLHQLDAAGMISRDVVHELGAGGTDALSALFGNTVGLVELRKGKLYGRAEVVSDLRSVLRPLDILVEKTPFRLTDKFIPGHFGHVAIWAGTPQELKALGVWDDPAVAPYHSQLEGRGGSAPAQVVEALRSGVQLSPLERFINVDDVAVLRPVALSADPDPQKSLALVKEALILAFRQLGKDYDFNFDTSTTEKIVCSELIYVSFPSIAWPTERVLGRYTISPDNIAREAFSGSPLTIVRFYHDGEAAAGEESLPLLRRLVGKPPPAGPPQ